MNNNLNTKKLLSINAFLLKINNSISYDQYFG